MQLNLENKVKPVEDCKNIDPNIFLFAYATRRKFEAVNKEIGFFPADLRGACAIASATLFKVLKDAKYSPEFYCGESFASGGHCWIVVDNFIVDITATQFGKKNKRVSIVPINNDRKHYSWDRIWKHKLVPIKRAWMEQNPHSALAKKYYCELFSNIYARRNGNKLLIQNMTY
jgi:hypothetical protein